jgi:hypothetical protein
MASIPSEPIAVGGGSAAQQERLLLLLLLFIYYLFVFYANPLPSSIPPPLNLHNRQVDDCVTDDEEILIEGVQVDVLAEEVEEDVEVSVGVFAKVVVDDVNIIDTDVAGRRRRIRWLKLRSSPRGRWWQSGGGELSGVAMTTSRERCKV